MYSAPRVCPSAEYTVYFEFARATLNQAALETLEQAVAQSRRCNIAAVQIVGHTDTSGSPAANLRLATTRANVVRDALLARGVATELVRTRAAGEGEVARATGDGVREPLNRRSVVQITYR